MEIFLLQNFYSFSRQRQPGAGDGLSLGLRKQRALYNERHGAKRQLRAELVCGDILESLARCGQWGCFAEDHCA
jgi:hypothetical protein